jgi:hypothetical protein
VNKYSAKVLKRSITFVLRVWPNSPQKINKMQSICYCPDWTRETGLQLIAREECRQGTDGFQMVSPLLHVGLLRQGGKGKVAPREKERDGKGLVTLAVYIEETWTSNGQGLITHMWSIRPLNQACEYQNGRVLMRSSHPLSPIDHPSNGSKRQIFGQLRSLFLFFFGVTVGESKKQHPKRNFKCSEDRNF